MKLDELEQLEKAATPGPWERVAYAKSDHGFVMMLTGGEDEYEAEQNARFVAVSRSYMPKLLAVARAAKGWTGYLAVHDMGVDLIAALEELENG